MDKHYKNILIEYCESRANPTLEKSDYLNTLGLRLNPNISVLWTGEL